MSKKTPIILIRSLDIVRGGITKASITRANMLTEKYNEVIIITFLFQRNHNAIIKELKNNNLLSKKIKVFNFFEDIKPQKRILNILSKKNKGSNISKKNLIEVPVKKNKQNNSFRYYRNGVYELYKRYDKNKKVNFIDYMNDSRHRLKREEYDENEILVRTRHMDLNLNKPRLDRYFDSNGNCFMSVWINPKTNAERGTITFLKKSKEYKDLEKLKTEWLQTILNKIPEPVVMVEQRSLDKTIRKISHKKIKKIGVVHASHLDDPNTDIYKNTSGYTKLFKNTNNFNEIVLLTEEQKKDVIEVYGNLNHLRVIPHVFQQDDAEIKKIETNPNLAVTLARFHKVKQLDHAINAFSYVVEKIPSAEYHIYGYGPEEIKLQKLIKKLNLENNVFLKNYTLNSAEVYQSAACSILTSQREGFGMVITESMAMGTPVVSYDNKYGPKDIIINGINGYIVAKGDKKALAEKVIDIMTNEKTYKKLSKNALDVRITFSKQNFFNRWVKLIEDC